MIHDATVEVTCDGNNCGETVVIEPEFVYPDYSGKNGYYDTKDSSLEKKIKREGWSVINGQHLCESCSPQEDSQ